MKFIKKYIQEKIKIKVGEKYGKFQSKNINNNFDTINDGPINNIESICSNT